MKSRLNGWQAFAWLWIGLTVCLTSHSFWSFDTIAFKFVLWAFGAAIMAIGFIGKPMPSPWLVLKRNPVLWLWLLFLIACLPGVVLSQNPEDGWLIWCSDLLVFAFAWMLSAALSQAELQKVVPRFALGIVLVLGVWGCWEWISALDGGVLTHRGTYDVKTSLGHRNLYSQFILMAALLALPIALSKSRLRPLAWVALLIGVFMGVLLLSRGAWILLFVCVLVFLLVKRPTRWWPMLHRRWKWASVAVAASILVTLALTLDEWYTIGHHFETAFDFSKGTMRDRWLLAERSFSLFLDHPLNGIGAGMWRIEIMQFDQTGMLTESATLFYHRSHNDFLWVFSESGVVAGVLYLAVFVTGLVQSWRHYRSRQDMFSLAIFIAWVGFTLVSFSNFPRERMEFGLMLALLIAAISRPFEVQETIKRPWFAGTMAAAALITMVPFSRRLYAEQSMDLGIKGRTTGNIDAYYDYTLQAKQAGLYIESSIFPLEWHLGEALRMRGETEEAKRLFEQAKRHNQYHPWIDHSIGLCHIALEDSDSALLSFEGAVTRTPRFQEAWLHVADMQCQQDDLPVAVESFLKADPVQPNPHYDVLGVILGSDSLDGMIDQFPERKLMLTITAMRNTSTWSLSVIRKTSLNGLPFTQQALMDACYYMVTHCEGEEDCGQCWRIKEKYLPGVDLDLESPK